MFDIPIPLIQAIENGEAALFLGAGIGRHLFNSKHDPAPLAADLVEEIVDEFDLDTNLHDLAQVTQIVEKRGRRTDLEAFLRQRLQGLEPDEKLQWLFSFRWRAIFTTNYDSGIERAYALNSNPLQMPVTISVTSELAHYDTRIYVPIYHLHGALFGVESPQIVITESDYIKFHERRRMIFDLLKYQFAVSTFLYIGYSNSDPNWKLLIEEIQREYYPTALPVSYRIAPSTDPGIDEILSSKNIITLNGTYEDFFNLGLVRIKAGHLNVDLLDKIRNDIPSDLEAEFDRSQTSVVRLLNSWVYLNQESFTQPVKVDEFLKGSPPTWSLLAAKQFFKRDIEDEVYEQLLDYATAPEKQPNTILVLAPAAYGITTLLMTLAVRLVADKAGAVFVLRIGRDLDEGSIDYAISVFPDNTVFFIVDNASDHVELLANAIDRLKNLGRKAVFLLGDRTNEWRQKRSKFVAREFALEALSDPEIYRLLDFLGQAGALNKLEELKPDMQFAVIKEKHKKQLLVVLREATENNTFEAILQSEFHGINDPVAQNIYLCVSCFHQHNTLLRTRLLASISKVTLVQLYEYIERYLEGVIEFEVLNDVTAEDAVRTRHRVIANVVWELGAPIGAKEPILQAAMTKLNLAYGVDRIAFERLVREDNMVDSIQTLEGRMRFFEAASQNEPDSPYVKQHYARMLMRAGNMTLALDQIENAIRLRPKARILYHTKGIILSKMATSADNIDIGRRYLFQSEQSYRTALRFQDQDEYVYHGLAELYFLWGLRMRSGSEHVLYIEKAEQTIAEGLRKARTRERLWVLSSDINDWFGNTPSRIHDLEQAISENSSSVYARYILGRAYRKMGKPEEALRVLDFSVKHHFDDFRAFVEYAISLVQVGGSYKGAIAVLRQSITYGLGDPRFIATLGGLLFMDKQYGEADKIFNEVSRRNFTYEEAMRIQYYPPDPIVPSQNLRISGKVVSVRTGAALIDTNNAPKPVICPSSKFNGLVMTAGLPITFEIGFRATGAVATVPQRA